MRILMPFVVMSLIVFTTNISAQKVEKKNFIFVSNDFELKQNRVLIKWFSEVLKTKEGYNLYRRREGETNWIKLNGVPLNQVENASASTKNTQNLNAYFEAVKKSSENEINSTGMIKAMVKMNCVEDFAFAQDMGMAFVDVNVARGDKFQYEVRLIKSKIEFVVETSPFITVQPWKALPPPDGFIIEKKKKGAAIGWLHEDKKFYSANVFRKKRGENDFTKLNETPILVRKNDKGQYDKFLFFDEKIMPNDVVTYKIQSIDFFGQVSEFSDDYIVGRKDFEFPAQPDSVFYDADSLNVKVWWKPNLDADLLGYNIYRSRFYDKDFVKLNTKIIPKATTKFTDIVPEPNDYFYKVSALDSSMNERDASPVMADVRDVIAPAVPKNFKATAEAGKMILTWDANQEKDLKGYNIYKAPLGAQEFIIANGQPLKTNRYEEKMPKQVKTPYTYKILAIDTNFNKSDFTKAIMLTMPDLNPPGQPLIKNIVIKDEKPVITWMANVDNDLKCYALFRTKIGKDTTRIPLSIEISKTDTIFKDKTAETNENYKYALFAVDSSGNLSPSSDPFSFKFLDFNTKLKVKKFDAKYNKKDKTNSINWTLEVDKNYYGTILFRAFESEEMMQYTPKLVEQTEYIDKSVKKPGKYTYQIRIYDKLGNVARSQELTVKVIAD